MDYPHCTDCDVCGSITMVREVEGGGTICSYCEETPEDCPDCGEIADFCVCEHIYRGRHQDIPG